MLDLHNLLRWFILILLLVNIIKNYASINKPFTTGDKKLGLWLMICAHTTFLVGLILLIIKLTQLPAGVSVMKNDALRFSFVEHPVAMLIAIVLITIGRGVFRKNISDAKKHTRAATLFLLALIVILAMIPWATSSLVPGM
ncbi:hypothetical protein A9P82_03595 [Arachidicoccus ginsenosidimutans]|nr:hypothetical protein A9P82_03595 [Arachidicoccus sp. BS20]